MTPTEQIDALIAGLTDWRGKTLALVRQAILAADPGISEEWKWMRVAVAHNQAKLQKTARMKTSRVSPGR